MKIRFVTVDVFTDRQFGGNPLAVVLNAEWLESDQMQQIANEFNLAETTFVLPPRDKAHTAEVRIFTPLAEVPFAGHPNIGTAYTLARGGTTYGRPVGDRLMFEEKAGLVEIDVQRKGREVTGARLAAPQKVSLGEEVPVQTIADACSIDVSDIETSHHAPRLASAGIPFVMTELKTRQALASASPRADVFTTELPTERAIGVHLYLPAKGDEGAIQCRMFAPLMGVPEDPATGSANVALIGFLASLEADSDMTFARTIAQGVDMGRPSLLHAEARKEKGEVTATWIGGGCAPMMEGTLLIREDGV